MEHNHFTELFNAVKTSDPAFAGLQPGEDEAAFSARLLAAVGTLNDAAWAGLSVETQTWFNDAAAQLNAGTAVVIPGYETSLADGSAPVVEIVPETAAPAAPVAKAKKEKAVKAPKEPKPVKEKPVKVIKEKAVKPVKEKVSSYTYVPSEDGFVPATLFLRREIVNAYLAGTEIDSKTLAAAADAAKVAVNESTINTVYNHAVGFLRAIDSVGAKIVK
jgi:hypothetical protein